MAKDSKLNKEDISEIFSKSTIKTAIQLLPYPIGNFITNVINECSYKNIEIFMRMLEKRIEKIENKEELLNAQDKKYFTMIFIDIIEKIKFEFIEEKIKYFQIFFTNMIVLPVNEKNYNERAFYLEILKNISISEIKLLHILYQIYPQSIKIQDFLTKFRGSEYLIKSFIEKMKIYGVLEILIFRINFGNSELSEGNEIILTSLGKNFCNFCIKE